MLNYYPIHNISPGLFLGNMRASENLALLKENKITHILVVGCDLEKHFPQEFVYHQVEVIDVEFEDMISHFHACIDFIENGLKTGGVFVHCAAGISRSTTMIVAYLMQKNNWDLDTALRYTVERRKCVWPNMGFQNQLTLFHKLAYKVDIDHPEVKELKEQLQKKKAQSHIHFR